MLETDKERFPTKAIIIAAGIGAFSPRRLPQRAREPWYGRGIYDVVTDPKDFRGSARRDHRRRRLRVRLGHAARWIGDARDVVHRSDRFRAHGATVAQFQATSRRGARRCSPSTSCVDVIEHAEGERFSHIVLKDMKAKTTREIEADVVLPMLGFVSDIGPIAEWGLTLEKDEIVVNQVMETGRPGIWAAGDVTTYPGKLKLIACGFGEAATAVNQAVHWIYPEKKVAPGHSATWRSSGRRTTKGRESVSCSHESPHLRTRTPPPNGSLPTLCRAVTTMIFVSITATSPSSHIDDVEP